MSSDLVSIISNIVKEYDEKNSPIVIYNCIDWVHNIYRINDNRYKWTCDNKTKFLTKKGLLMYYKKWFMYENEEDIQLECGIFTDIVFRSSHCDDDEFVEECMEKLEWLLEFQQECYD